MRRRDRLARKRVDEVGFGGEDQRDRRTREVRVDVEQRVGLRADKVVRRDWSTAGDADRLREAEDALRARRTRPERQ